MSGFCTIFEAHLADRNARSRPALPRFQVESQAEIVV
jgi:hypothetical protein